MYIFKTARKSLFLQKKIRNIHNSKIDLNLRQLDVEIKDDSKMTVNVGIYEREQVTNIVVLLFFIKHVHRLYLKE